MNEPRHEPSGAIQGCECDLCNELRQAARIAEVLNHTQQQDAPTGTQDAGQPVLTTRPT